MPRTPPPEEPLVPEPPGAEDDDAAALTDLAALAAELGRAAEDSAEEARLSDDIFKRIDRLAPDARKRLFTRPAMRALFEVAADKDPPPNVEDPPGTIYYRVIAGERTPWSKKPWTWGWLWAHYPTKTWEPSRRIDLGFNGLLVTVFPHREVTLPEVFYGIYRDHVRNTELAEQHRDWLFKKRHTLADESIMTAAGLESRETANHDGSHNVCAPGGGAAGIDHSGAGDMDREPARAG